MLVKVWNKQMENKNFTSKHNLNKKIVLLKAKEMKQPENKQKSL